jgi:hypothetical protein
MRGPEFADRQITGTTNGRGRRWWRGDRSRTVGASRAVAASPRPGRTASHVCWHLLQGWATRHKPLRLIIAAVAETPADARGLSPCRSPDLLEELVTPSALDHDAPICGRPHDGPCDLGLSCGDNRFSPSCAAGAAIPLATRGSSRVGLMGLPSHDWLSLRHHSSRRHPRRVVPVANSVEALAADVPADARAGL